MENVNLLVSRVVDDMGIEDMEQLMILWNRFIDQMDKEVNELTEEMNKKDRMMKQEKRELT